MALKFLFAKYKSENEFDEALVGKGHSRKWKEKKNHFSIQMNEANKII